MRWRPILATAAASYLTLQYLGRTSGSTRQERRRTLPGDEIVTDPTFVTNHAVTIDAPPSAVWPWLIQMGWHQGGFYTSPVVDRLLFPANWPAVDHIIPELQDRRVGDFVPDGPPESKCGYFIEAIERDRFLVLRSTSHLPPSWSERTGAWVSWSWAFMLEDLGDGRSRLLFRCRGKAGPWWLLTGYVLTIVPADFIMSRQMMEGVARRARSLAHDPVLPTPVRAG